MKELKDLTNEELWQLFPIVLSEHKDYWTDDYNLEEQLLMEVIGTGNIARINHIGSTSVPQLLSKPTIDILLEIKQAADTDSLIKRIESIGYIYTYQPNNPTPHMMFMKGYTLNGFEEKVFHLHVRYFGDWDELYFRDYLKQYPEVAKQYGQLKLELKDKFQHDRDAYTEAKTDFIRKYTNLGRKEFPNKYL
ncbi:GrpB family protein [Dysgonomonas sp. Marseille-P4677]|uniref:GrpB family protein n=1 Tax=Dysgonomonas sp. Marseille-P4677 TaxID=2364790 RepID=UPI001913C983|nr:GrpB family protein [Dysgonomonas sp. Marseille-P4677]MBK5719877.1 GrpB family protein [Dysgonomonas sp. Marseille-P4677]